MLSLYKQKTKTMKGLTFITNETSRKRFAQVDLSTVRKHEEVIEDIIDIIIAESRKDEEKIPIEEVKRQLKKLGKV